MVSLAAARLKPGAGGNACARGDSNRLLLPTLGVLCLIMLLLPVRRMLEGRVRPRLSTMELSDEDP